MNIDTLIMLLFALSIPLAWWAQRRSILGMTTVAVLTTTVVGLRALYVLEYGPRGTAGVLSGMFFVGLFAVWFGVRQARQ